MNRILIAVCLVGLLAGPLSLTASASHASGVPRWVEGDLTITYESLTQISVTGELLVREFDASEGLYTAEDIRDSYRGANRFGSGVGDDFVEGLEAQVKTALGAALGDGFPHGTVTVTQSTFDRASLDAASTGPHDPPVVVEVAAMITNPPEAMGLDGQSPEAIDAFFEAGARVLTDAKLATRAGYGLTYHMQAPPGLAFAEPSDGTLSADGSMLSVTRDNTRGATTLSAPISFVLFDRSAQAPEAEVITTSITIGLGEIGASATSIPLSTTVEVALESINVEERFPGVLPANVQLEHLDADAIRKLRDAGALSDAMWESAEASILDTITASLASSMQGDAEVTGGFDESTLDPALTDEPVVVAAEAESDFPLEGDTAGNLDLALDIGATISLEVDLFSSEKGDNAFTIEAPPGMVFSKAESGTLSADGRSATFEVPAGADAAKASISMRKAGAIAYTASDATLGIVVDLKDLDIEIGKAINGDYGELLVDVRVLGSLLVIEVPEDVRANFDERVELDFLTSDAVRQLHARGLLTQERLDELETAMLDQMRENLGRALGQPLEVVGGFDRASLAADLPADAPVLFSATTSLRQPLSPGAGASAALALYTAPPQTFTLPRVQGLDTTYTIILPKGLAIMDLQSTGGTATQGKASDGRHQFTMTPEEENSQATVTMAVTPTLIVSKFLPLVIGAVVLLVLLIGTPIALVMRKRG